MNEFLPVPIQPVVILLQGIEILLNVLKNLVSSSYALEHQLSPHLTLSSSVTLNSSPVEPGSTPTEATVPTALIEQLNTIHGVVANRCQ